MTNKIDGVFEVMDKELPAGQSATLHPKVIERLYEVAPISKSDIGWDLWHNRLIYRATGAPTNPKDIIKFSQRMHEIRMTCDQDYRTREYSK